MADPTQLIDIRLTELIDGIETTTDDPLEQLTSAVISGAHLDDIADHLVGHFVDAARSAGASWNEVGRCLGVTKQAAQKRFSPKDPSAAKLDPSTGFGAFTERARNVVAAAHNDAKSAGNPEITAGHLAAALLDDETSLATLLLTRQNVDPAAVRRSVADASPVSDEHSELIPYDMTAKKALELTFRHALRLNHSYVGTEHILLALLEVENSDGPLRAAGANSESIEKDLTVMLDAMTP